MKILFFESQDIKESTYQNTNKSINASSNAKLKANKKAPKCDGNKLKFYFKSLLITFSVTAVLSFLLISNIDKNMNKKQNLNDYVSVFKESDLYEILFTENE
ncbi:MAG: hypothetical protein II984_11210 [Clostridia bacterium]|nr:hypothetical protein [Clostridia bacterium]